MARNMHRNTKTFALAFLAISGMGTTLAHEGVQNPAVLERMESMSTMVRSLTEMRRMSRGQLPFDAAKVEQAKQILLQETMRTPDLFEAEESDPRDEALPAIWTNWDDFSAANDRMLAVINQADPATQDELRVWIRDVGLTCAACHRSYRE